MNADQQQILDAMRRIDPRGLALITMRELRSATDMLRVEFDRAMVALCQAGACWMDQHDFPGGCTDDELSQMVCFQGDYYVAAGRRHA